MRLIDRIALSRLINTILAFIITLVKLLKSSEHEDSNKPVVKPRKRILDLFRRKK